MMRRRRTAITRWNPSEGIKQAFIGAFLFPLLLSNPAFRLPGAMGVAAFVALAGFALTFVLPEPDHKTLEMIEREGEREDQQVDMKAR